MSRLQKLFQYFYLLITLLFFLLMLNFGIIVMIAYVTKNNLSYIPINRISSCLSFNGEWQMGKEGVEMLNRYECFAMLIDASGRVSWEYDLPEEIPREYSLGDIASFTRWYLCDYPVFVLLREEGIFVIGAPKRSIWRYQIFFRTDTLEAYLTIVIPLFILDLCLLILVPIILIKRQTRKRERERTTWIAGVSHDIRTPLSLIMGYAGELKESEIQEELSDKAELIEEQAIRLRTLIQNLNMENKLTYGFVKLKKERVLLAAVLRETLCDIMNRETDGKYEFEIEIAAEAEGAKVRGDAELIKRLFENLLNNAVQHNPDGCHIYVEFGENSHAYMITIADNGKGMTMEQLRRFQRLKKESGLPEHGLGLRLVRQIAKMHHWKLRFSQMNEHGVKCEIRIKR